jgi:DNA repair protein RadC
MDKPHYINHRKRLRERFRKTGFDGFSDYEALELLLTYPIPRKDVKPLAKALIERFKTFHGVIEAPYEELITVEGLGESTATYISMLKECAGLFLKEQIIKKKQISTTAALLNYCKIRMSNLKDEQFRAIFLNSQNEVITDEIISEGTVNQSVVYPRKVMEKALYHKACAMIVVHNHPSGNLKPSNEDLLLTKTLRDAAKSLQLKIHDHLIISNQGYFSFLEAGLM